MYTPIRAMPNPTSPTRRPCRPPTLPTAVAVIALATTLCCQSRNPRFHRLDPAKTGVTFQTHLATDHPMSRLYHSGFSCGGVAVGDLDGDGRPDLFLVGGPEKNQLYRQKAPLRFADVTATAGVGGGDRWGAGAALADIDNDGDLDIYVANYMSGNQLFINRGDWKFSEEGEARGLAIKDACIVSTFCDFDRDGDLDVYLVTYRAYHPGGQASSAEIVEKHGGNWTVKDAVKTYYDKVKVTLPDGRTEYTAAVYGRDDYLLRNDGTGKFEDITKSAGVSGHGYGLSATWWDYDADGWPDLYVSNDFDDPDRLYRNNGDGTFTDVLVDVVPHTTWYSMGSASADLNNDGLLDMFVADMSARTHFMQKTTMGAMNAKAIAKVAGPPPQYMRNTVYLNTGTGRMFEGAHLLGLSDTDWTWCIRLADLDNDGHVDAYVTNGMTRSFNNSDIAFRQDMLVGSTHFDLYKNAPTRPEQNLAYRNTGDLGFEDVSKRWGLDHRGLSFGAALSDLDGDGALDLVVANLDEPTSIYHNRGGGNWLSLRLRGRASNRFGIGAVVRLKTGNGVQVRQLFPTSGTLGSDEPIVYFGLGTENEIAELTVTWPSGATQRVSNVTVNRRRTITEPETAPIASAEAPPAASPTLFAKTRTLRGIVHEEDKFDDFALQPLLPNRLSRLGPGTAWGDIDGDGDDDVYIGGATGQAGFLMRNAGGGSFTPIRCRAILGDSRCEDMGALFFDADSDGDLDLYVVSGSVRFPRSIPFLRDRLYLNDGTGAFAKAPRSALPSTTVSGSVVAAADYDRDGDLDLFVGTRVTRGKYPLAPASRLLRNDGGTFTDVAENVAASLQRSGLVTSAIWSDANGDGWIDLLVTNEWGPVRFFANERGKLVERTQAAGLATRTGWWNGIAGRDVDGDGDIDYAVTNFGLNTKYHATAKRPALLYYGDFEKKGAMRLVEAEFENEQLFPIRGKSCSTKAMPSLGGKFTTYKSFALAELAEVYTKKCLNEAHRYAATTLESGILLNDGKGRFTFRPLPRLAQISPGFGVVFTEVDGDDKPDLCIIQNFYGPQPETGHMDGGLGLLLRGLGDGTFEPVWPATSGLIVAADAKSLTTTDLDGDGRLDLVVGVNDGPAQSYVATSRGPIPITVSLRGTTGNPTAVGARVTIVLEDGSSQTAEVQAGSGYLSQSSPVLAFGGNGRRVQSVRVRWPGGKTAEFAPRKDQRRFSIAEK